jgi:hypothetical protein
VSERLASKCRDCMGHSLAEGDWVSILPPSNIVWIAKVAEIQEGGVLLTLGKNERGMSPSKVRLVLDITMNANPQMPIFPSIVRVLSPGSEELVEKTMEASDEKPPSPSNLM